MRNPGRTGVRALVATAAAATLVVGATSTADAHDSRALAPRTHFTMAADGSSGATAGGAGIPNIDSVKSTIRAYYNATDGIADQHSSPYITEMKRIENAQWGYLVNAYYDAVDAGRQPALVLDADDTTLMTYDMEDGAMHFNFDPTLQDEWVQDERFPATPGMVNLVNRAARLGYTVFGLTGRNDDQKAATLGNLDTVGYAPFDDDTFYTKWTGVGDSQQPDYITCATAKCTTVEYKAGTRRHIEEDLGYDIVLNVGDQWSDLQGGFADQTLKLPNPTYYLPSPNLPGVDEPELAPRTRFTMKPDGSSGLTQGGEGIANIDSVKSTIRTYYNATDGIADKRTSPYITEMRRLTRGYAHDVRSDCRAYTRSYHGKRAKRPAIVLDADDTTLWTYDMEDAAMAFDFDPVLQDEWVQDQRFPATPGMARVVRAARNSGCKIVGLTGRSTAQQKATIANLNKYYDGAFTKRLYFTKWVDPADQPSYIHCAAEKCTTVEYKSQTRRHLEKALGLKILANYGDQFSDLLGGHARRTVKLPNPTYYLP